jgi:hypothetical protein
MLLPDDHTGMDHSGAIVDIPIEFSVAPLRVEPTSRPDIRHFPAKDMQLIHEELLSLIRPERLGQPRTEDKQELRQAINNIIVRHRMPFSGVERDQLTEQILDQVYGYGPLQPLIDDDTVDDILVNTHATVYVERKGLIEKTTPGFIARNISCTSSTGLSLLSAAMLMSRPRWSMRVCRTARASMSSFHRWPLMAPA